MVRIGSGKLEDENGRKENWFRLKEEMKNYK